MFKIIMFSLVKYISLRLNESQFEAWFAPLIRMEDHIEVIHLLLMMLWSKHDQVGVESNSNLKNGSRRSPWIGPRSHSDFSHWISWVLYGFASLIGVRPHRGHTFVAIDVKIEARPHRGRIYFESEEWFATLTKNKSSLSLWFLTLNLLGVIRIRFALWG